MLQLLQRTMRLSIPSAGVGEAIVRTGRSVPAAAGTREPRIMQTFELAVFTVVAIAAQMLVIAAVAA